MLESIFGKSKKSRQKNNNSDNNNDNSPNDDNNFVIVGGGGNNDPNRAPYPQTIMLNDELIKMGSSSTIPPSSIQSIYPNLNPSLPYSNHNNNNRHDDHHNHLNINKQCRTCSPIDNIPFSLIGYNGNDDDNDRLDNDELEIIDVINRMENFMETSKYEFNLENSILRESI